MAVAPAEAPPRMAAIHWAVAAGLVIITFIVFAQLRNHEFLTFDDPIYVTNNEQVKKGLTADGIAWAFRSLDFNWHPLTWITHMIDVSLFGVNAGPHLLVNAAIHAINAILVFFLFTRLTAFPWRSAFVAAIFAVHPLHVESVAWLSERKDVLSALLFLITLHLYVTFVRSRSRAVYAAMLATFILSLMAKGMPITLPFVLLLLDWWPLRRMQSFQWSELRPLIVEKLAFVPIMIAAAVITLRAQQAVESLAAITTLSFPLRLANAAIAYMAYVRKALWPSDLAVPYEYGRTVSPTATFISAILLIAITAAVIMLRRRRYLFTGWFWFVGMIVPVSGIVQIGVATMADRYTYLPLIGLSAAIVWLIADFVADSPSLRFPAAIASGVIVVALVAAAHAQASHWRNTFALFSHTLTVQPENAFASTSVGDAMLLAGRFDDAIRHFQRAIQISPNSDMPHAGLGSALAATGRTEAALASFRRAVEINPKNQGALFEIGRLEMSSGRGAQASETLQRAAELANTPLSLGTLALSRNDLQEALKQFQRAVTDDPKSSEARNNLGATLARLGRDDEAVKQYEEALRLTPDHYDGHMNLGALLSRMGRNADAASHFETASRLRPQSPEPLVYGGLVLASDNRNKEAAEVLRRAMNIDAAAANLQFTNALRMPPKETNLQEFVTSLEAKQ